MRSFLVMSVVLIAASIPAADNLPPNGTFERVKQWTVFERRAHAPEKAGLPKEVTRKTSPRDRLEAAFGWPIRVRGRIVKESPEAYYIRMFDDMPAVLMKDQTKVIGTSDLPEGWRFHDVVRPARITVAKGEGRDGSHAVILSTSGSGRAFLHSSIFPVQTGENYEVALWAKGPARVGLQLVWWERYDRVAIVQAHPHLSPAPLKGKRGLIAEMNNVGPKWRRLRAGPFKAPTGAVRCYIRIMTIEGRAVLDDVEVQVVAENLRGGE